MEKKKKRKEKKLKERIVFSGEPLDVEDKIISPQRSEENSNLLQQHISELKELDKALIQRMAEAGIAVGPTSSIAPSSRRSSRVTSRRVRSRS